MGQAFAAILGPCSACHFPEDRKRSNVALGRIIVGCDLRIRDEGDNAIEVRVDSVGYSQNLGMIPLSTCLNEVLQFLDCLACSTFSTLGMSCTTVDTVSPLGSTQLPQSQRAGTSCSTRRSGFGTSCFAPGCPFWRRGLRRSVARRPSGRDERRLPRS